MFLAQLAEINRNANVMTGPELTILLVEDDDVDVMAMQRALKKKRVLNSVTIARDGIEACDLLRGENGKEKIARPFIILLDLNMPRMNGLEFLDVIRNDPKLNNLIVFVLTTSNSDEDKCRAYKKNIAGYILKDNLGEGFVTAVSMLDLYWNIVEMPK